MTDNKRDDPGTGTELNRRILSLVGAFRLLAAVLLITLALLPDDTKFVALRYPDLFTFVAGLYALGAICIVFVLPRSGTRAESIAWLQLVLDIVCISLLVHSAGGIGSGIESLIVVFVTAAGMTLPPPRGYFAAAIAAVAILFEQSISYFDGVTTAAEFFPAGVNGGIMLAILLALQPLLKRVSETESLARQRGIDLENLEQLNDYIIRTLREAILVVDEKNRIRLLNNAATENLGRSEIESGTELNTVSTEVSELLARWRSGEIDLSREIPSFVGKDGASVVNAHFAPLGNGGNQGPVLIFLEDASLLTEKVQQSKLAALGRLSASIAHEIRNPVGALSHAAQLLQESPSVGVQEQRFIEIIQKNTQRVSQIVDNVLQLSRKEVVVPEILDLNEWTPKFIAEFESTLELPMGQLKQGERSETQVRMDRSHLHQIIWNLCENAIKHGGEETDTTIIDMRYGRLPNNGRPYFEIADDGAGIPEDMQEAIFEPFATGRTGGTGLGLFICRELCERNGATLRYRSGETGGSVFQIVFADPNRWNTST